MPETEDCSGCGGTGKKTVRRRDADGVTRSVEVKCNNCNGTGKQFRR